MGEVDLCLHICAYLCVCRCALRMRTTEQTFSVVSQVPSTLFSESSLSLLPEIHLSGEAGWLHSEPELQVCTVLHAVLPRF